ncbi:hypothetical protein OSTOST_21696 [Ostertagia ostertagi]
MADSAADTIFDLPIGNLSCTNNGVQASGSYLAFHVEGEGGKLGALPINAKGRKLRKDMSIVKIWRLSGEEATNSLECEIHVGNGVLLDSIKPHSTASNIIAAASLGDAYVIDIERNVVATKLDGFVDKGQSLDWSEDGKLLAISADKGREKSDPGSTRFGDWAGDKLVHLG